MKNKKLIIFITIILLLFVFLLVTKDKILRIIYPKKYQEIVSIYAKDYEIEENLIYALIKSESNFNKDAVSNKGAVGLMQLMENTAKDVIRSNNLIINTNDLTNELLNVTNNINIGTKYISTLLEKYGNKEVALAAYNAGTGTVDNWINKNIIKADGSDIENIPYKETNNYVRKILRDYKIYQKLYSQSLEMS